MKLKCIDNKVAEKKGLFGIGAEPEHEVSGLTKGKIYHGFYKNEISGGGTMTVSSSDSFFLYDDNNKWNTYECERFSPVE